MITYATKNNYKRKGRKAFDSPIGRVNQDYIRDRSEGRRIDGKRHFKSTAPAVAGGQNFTREVLNSMEKDVDNGMKVCNATLKHGLEYPYSEGWTEEELRDSLTEFFDFMSDFEVKPTVPALALWLRVPKTILQRWRLNSSGQYDVQQELIENAYSVMEMHLQNNIEKYPTGSIFLLKTTHKHIETSKLEVEKTDMTRITAEDIDETLAKMGFSKPESE